LCPNVSNWPFLNCYPKEILEGQVAFVTGFETIVDYFYVCEFVMYGISNRKIHEY
jgi:hypothetical protein